MTDERLKSSRKDDERLEKSPQKRKKALINFICVKSLNNFIIMDNKTDRLVKTLRHYFEAQPVLKVWLFGSYARGDEKSGSDIDILVAFDDSVSLFKYASMQSDLEELLDRNVDLVSETSLFPWVKETVYNDRILIYERETA